jgi:3-methyladenine DNA glycosylase AlkD
MKDGLSELKKDLKKRRNEKKAKIYRRFFKTNRGEYAAGDVFFGISSPELNVLATKYRDISIRGIEKILHSEIHEARSLALRILVKKYESGNDDERIYRAYIRNLRWINNWDLVDISASAIVGRHLFNRDKKNLFILARSKNVWSRRVAMIASFYFIKQGVFSDALSIAEILVHDPHDLIRKAVGWMLREVGKRSLHKEEVFLRKYYKTMPRVTLRYAIERFPEAQRIKYLKGFEI